MGFLFVWMLGCVLGGQGAGILGPGSCLLAALGVASLSAPLARRGRIWARAISLMLTAMALGAYSAPSPIPLASPEGIMWVEGQVDRSSLVGSGRLQVRLSDVSLDGEPIESPLHLFAPGFCAWPHGALWRGPVLLRASGRPVTNLRLRAQLTHRVPFPGPCLEETMPFPEVTLPSEDTSGLLRALILGDRSGLKDLTREHFVDTGTMHLLAISGLHLGVVAWGLYRILCALLCGLGPMAWTRNNPRMASLGAGMGTWFAVGAITPSDATLRAAWAVTFVFLASVSGRSLRPLRALALAAAALLSLDPTALFGPSFQLSFAAVIAIIFAAQRCRDFFKEAPGEAPEAGWGRSKRGRLLLCAMALNTAAFLATAPLGLAWFGQVAFLSPLVNLVATPYVSVVAVPMAVTWTALATLWPSLASLLRPLLSTSLGVLLDGVEVWADVAGSSQGATWSLPWSLVLTVGLLLLLAPKVPWRRAWVVLGAGAVGIVALSGPPADWTVTMIDVGHGDAILIQGPRGEAALVDAGGHPRDPARGESLARRKVLPTLARLGVDHLDLLVLTHGDLDHVGGAGILSDRLAIDELWVSSCPQRPMVGSVAQTLLLDGGRVIRISSAPPIPWGDASLEVLWPLADEPCLDHENGRSIVLRLHTPGGRVLLTGDVGSQSERQLLARDPDLLAADVLKVGHHGSAGSSTPDFLSAVGAVHGLISAPGGRGALPSSDALSRLEDAGVRSWRTGLMGSVRVTLRPGHGPQVEALRTP